MAYPRFIDEVALASDPFDVTQVYTDLSVRTRVRSFARGRQKETVQPDPGRSSTTFEDSDRALDPVNAASIYYPNVLPMRRIRARVQGWLSEPAASPLTVSGNEVTDATRAASAALGTGSSGQMCDGLSNDSSFGIRRAATNLFRRGQCDATTDWSVTTGGVETTATDATVVPPFSTQSVKLTADGGAANQGIIPRTATGQAAAAGTIGVGSVYVKGVAGQSYRAFLQWVNTDASSNSGGITTFVATGGWQLIAPASLAVAVGKTGDLLKLRIDINGTRAESFWVAHGMLEKAQSVVAPYVASSGGATATHNAGRVQAPSTLLNAAQGWVALRVRMWGAAAARAATGYAFSWSDGGPGNNQIGLRWSTGQNWVALMGAAGVQNANAITNTGGGFAAGDVLTVIVAWDAGSLKVSVNGEAFVSVARTVGTPTGLPATFDIGSFLAGSLIDADILWAGCGTGTLTGADATAINAFGNTDKNPEEFNDATNFRGSCQAVMPFNTAAYRVTKDAILYTNFVDTEQGWLIDQLGPGQAEAIAPANDGFDVLNTFKLSSTQTYPQQTAGARIVAILDTQGWPAAERSIDVVSQQSLVQAANAGDLSDVSALSAIEAAAANDNGVFFIDGRGYAVFLGRHRETDPRWATSQATFCDKANYAPGRILYKSIPPSSSRIRNEYRVTRNGGTEQVWPVGGASPSITKYRLRSEAVSTLHATDAEALNYAQYRVLLDKDPHRRYDEMTIIPLDDTATWRALLGLGIGDRITVFYTPPGGGAADQRDMLIEGISATIGPGVESSWTYRLSPVSDLGGWVIGHAQFGLLGSTTVLTYALDERLKF